MNVLKYYYYPVNNLKNLIRCSSGSCNIVKIWTSLTKLHSTKHDWKKYLQNKKKKKQHINTNLEAWHKHFKIIK